MSLRKQFEKWHFDRFQEELSFNEERNLYEDFAHHQAWLGWQAAKDYYQVHELKGITLGDKYTGKITEREAVTLINEVIKSQNQIRGLI